MLHLFIYVKPMSCHNHPKHLLDDLDNCYNDLIGLKDVLTTKWSWTCQCTFRGCACGLRTSMEPQLIFQKRLDMDFLENRIDIISQSIPKAGQIWILMKTESTSFLSQYELQIRHKREKSNFSWKKEVPNLHQNVGSCERNLKNTSGYVYFSFGLCRTKKCKNCLFFHCIEICERCFGKHEHDW